MVSSEGQLLLPVALQSLAYPSALALAPAMPTDGLGGAAPPSADGQPAPFVYVAEMAANRVLRFARRPVDVFLGSVFYQFSGGAGPSALACAPDGTLFVGHFEYAGAGVSGGLQQGKISKLSPRVCAESRGRLLGAARACVHARGACYAQWHCSWAAVGSLDGCSPTTRAPNARRRARAHSWHRTDHAPPALRRALLPLSKHGHRQGDLLEELFVPAPEVTGLALKGRTLYVTESSTNSLFAIEL